VRLLEALEAVFWGGAEFVKETAAWAHRRRERRERERRERRGEREGREKEKWREEKGEREERSRREWREEEETGRRERNYYCNKTSSTVVTIPVA
jgi:hypothetical protein